MSIRHLIVIAVLLASALMAGVRLGAQVARNPVPVPPTVMAGPDVGFRVEGVDGDMPVGRLVLRIKGNWVEAQIRDGRLVAPAK